MSHATILETIIAQKHVEIAHNSLETPLEQLEKEAMQTKGERRGFIAALRSRMEQRKPAVIAEIKKASPSKGLIREDFNPAWLAQRYAAAGATCLSVLTDEQFFQGSAAYLQAARAVCDLPVIRKDFIIDRYQIAEAGAMGADCVLLIVSALTAEQLRDLSSYAQQLDIDVLVEVHDEQELQLALDAGFDLIGVNNRNLHTFETDLDTTHRLAALTPAGKLIVTESGIHTAADVQQMLDGDIYGFLVGESMMRAADPAEKFRELFGAGDP